MQARTLELKNAKNLAAGEGAAKAPKAEVGAASRRLGSSDSAAPELEPKVPSEWRKVDDKLTSKNSAPKGLKAAAGSETDARPWAELSQQETNEAVNQMAADAKDDESYREIADSMSDMSEDQMLAALGQLPEDTDADKIVDAWNEQRLEEVAGENAVVQKEARKQAEALQEKVETVRDARDRVLEQAGEAGDFAGDQATEALRKEMEQNPELANVLALSNVDVLDNVSAQLAMNPENSDETVRHLAAMGEKLEPEVLQQTLTDSLHNALGENVNPLLAGLTQGSLEGETRLLSSLEEGYQGPARDLLGQTRLSAEELAGKLESDPKLDGLLDAAEGLNSEVVKGMLNYLDQNLPEELNGIAEHVAGNIAERGSQQPGTAQMMQFSELMESANPELVERLGATMANKYLEGGVQADWENAGLVESISAGNPSLSLALMGGLAQADPERDWEWSEMRTAVDRGFADLAETYGNASTITDQANADLATLQQQFGPFGDEQAVQDASAEFLDSYQTEFAETDRLAEASLKGLQQLKEFDTEHPGVNQKTSVDDGYYTLLKEFNSLATNPSGIEQVGLSLASKGRGGPSFLDDLATVSEATSDPQAFRENANFLVTHGMQMEQAKLVAGGQQQASESLHGWASVTKQLGSDMSEAEVDRLVKEIEGFGEAALAAFLGGSQTSLTAAAETLLATPAGASPARERVARGVAAAVGLGTAGWDAFNGVDFGSREGWDFLNTVLPAGADAASLAAEWRGASSLAKNLGRVAPVFAGISALVNLADIAGEMNSDNPDYAAVGFQAAMLAGNTAAAVGGLATIWGTASWAGPVGWIGAGVATLATLGFSQYERVKESNRFEVGNGELSDKAYQFMETVLPPDFPRELIPSLMNSTDEGQLMGGMIQDMARRAGVSPQDMLAEFARLTPDQASDLIEGLHRWAQYYTDPDTAADWDKRVAAAEAGLVEWSSRHDDFAYPLVHFSGGGGGRMLVA